MEQRPAISKLTSHLMERLHSEVQKSGAEFVVWAVPSKFRLANVDRSFPEPEFADLWREWCQERDIAYVDLVEPFRQAVRNGKSLFFDEDIHFNKHGHAIAAQEIERVIRSQTDGR